MLYWYWRRRTFFDKLSYICTLHNPRKHYFDLIKRNCHNFVSLNSEQKLSWLMLTEDKNLNWLVSKLLLPLNKERDALMINGVALPLLHKTCFQFSCLLFFLECYAVFVLCECLFCQLFSYYKCMCIQINPIMYI